MDGSNFRNVNFEKINERKGGGKYQETMERINGNETQETERKTHRRRMKISKNLLTKINSRQL